MTVILIASMTLLVLSLCARHAMEPITYQAVMFKDIDHGSAYPSHLRWELKAVTSVVTITRWNYWLVNRRFIFGILRRRLGIKAKLIPFVSAR